MKILLLGYSDYLSNLLFFLNNTPFLIENDIDIMFANSSSSVNNFNLKSIKQISKHNLNKILAKILIAIYSKSYSKIQDELFQKVDLSFINYLSNVKILEFPGINNIFNLEKYDFMIVATLGHKIPANVFNRPKRRTLNIHPSYLPELRGGYPTYVEAYKLSSESGTTIHYMEDKWDNGDIIIQEKYTVNPKMSNNDRFLLSSQIAASLLNKMHCIKYNFSPKKQNDNMITYCHKIIKPKTELLLVQNNENIQGFLSANYAKHIFPFTFVFYNFKLLSIIEVSFISDISIIPEKHIDNSAIKVFRYNNNFILNFYGDLYTINKYIFKRKIHVN